MATDFKPINAFVGTGTGAKKLDFKEAYNKKLKDVLAFLKDASDYPNHYGVPDWQNLQPTLKEIYKCIESLTEQGICYDNPLPAQQIFRTKKNELNELEPTPAYPWATTDRRKAFWAICDLLGLFLSLLGPATSGATATNYFLPLAVVYARWCSAITVGTAKVPTMVQVTWVTKGGKQYPFLGAVAGGFAAKPAAWGDLVKRMRHSIMSDILQRPYTAYGYAPLLDGKERASWNLGNCAETYPFLYLLTDPTVKESSFGISIQVAKSADNPSKKSTEHPNIYDGKACWEGDAKVVMPPCLNCKTVLGWLGLEAREKDKCFELWNKK